MFAQTLWRWTILLAIPAAVVYLASLGLNDVRAQDVLDTQIERIAFEARAQLTAHEIGAQRADNISRDLAASLREKLDQPLTEHQLRGVLHDLKAEGFTRGSQSPDISALRWARRIERYAEGKTPSPAR